MKGSSGDRRVLVRAGGTTFHPAGGLRTTEPRGRRLDNPAEPDEERAAAARRPVTLRRQLRADLPVLAVAPVVGVFWALVDGTGVAGWLAVTVLVAAFGFWWAALRGSDPSYAPRPSARAAAAPPGSRPRAHVRTARTSVRALAPAKRNAPAVAPAKSAWLLKRVAENRAPPRNRTSRNNASRTLAPRRSAPARSPACPAAGATPGAATARPGSRCRAGACTPRRPSV